MMRTRSRSGFTLLEMIIYIGITAIVVVSLTNVMITVFETRENTESISEVQQVARIIMDRMTNALTEATSVTEDESGRVTVTLPDARKSPTVFFLQDGGMFITEGNHPAYRFTPSTIWISTFITDVTAEKSLDIELGVTDVSSDETVTLFTTVTLRQ